MVVLIRLPQTLGCGLNETSGIGQLLLYSINGMIGVLPLLKTHLSWLLFQVRGVSRVDKCDVDTNCHNEV